MIAFISAHQLDTIMTAAADLPVEHRDGLLRGIAAALRTWPPTDPELRAALDRSLGR
jgi:hypothetical protein